jgi:hypothetical protein
MKRFLPLLLLALGILLLIGGFFYDVVFAGVPYQDPTPEMSARYAFHSHIASAAYLLGGGSFLVGVAASIIRRFSRRQAS